MLVVTSAMNTGYLPACLLKIKPFTPEDVFESSHMWMEAETGGGTRAGNLVWLMCFLFLKKRKTNKLRRSNIQILLKHVGAWVVSSL